MKLVGRVIQGEQKASKYYDLPTANLALNTPVDLEPGVYVGQAMVDGVAWPSIICHGNKFEVHLFGYQNDLYGKELSVEVGERVSGMVPFTGEAQMKQKIASDVTRAKLMLGIN